jgi:hypothetical protein
MSVEPNDWLRLNWVKNHARFYYSAAKIGHPRQKGSQRRDAFEVIKPESQCKKALDCMNMLRGTPLYHENLEKRSECYICGLKITETGGQSMVTPAGCQCEHILTASTIAMLTGLPSDIYKSERDSIIEGLKKKSKMKDRFDGFIRGYEEFQNELWAILYDWAHPACNEYKGDHPFLRIDFKSKGLKVIPLSQTSDNIKKLLAILFYSETGTSDGETKLSLWRKSMKQQPTFPGPNEFDAYVLFRYYSVFQKVSLIETKLKDYISRDGGELLKHYSYLSTKTMLNVVVHKVLKMGPFKWIKPLEKLFKQSGEKLDSYIKRESNAKLRMPLSRFVAFMKQQVGGGPDKIIYYDEHTLNDDVILGALLLLRLDNSELFTDMDIDDMLFNIELIDLDEIIHGPSSQATVKLVHDFKQFCIFFRNYLNSENSVLYSISPDAYPELNEASINSNFRIAVINMTNYIWNVYSSSGSYNLKEIIVDGSAEVIDKLEEGPTIEEKALEHIDIIRVIKLLEEMGNELKDDAIEVLEPGLEPESDSNFQDYDISEGVNEDELRMVYEVGTDIMNTPIANTPIANTPIANTPIANTRITDMSIDSRPSKKHRGGKRGKNKTKQKNRINMNTEKDLRAMKFMIGDKVVSF